MNDTQWTQQDLNRIRSLGMDPAEVSRQLGLFRRPPAFARIDRPAVLADGITVLTPDEGSAALRHYEEARRLGRFGKFVPASGAASRMFLSLRQFLEKGMTHSRHLENKDSHPDTAQAALFMAEFRRAAFFDDLSAVLASQGKKIEDLLERGEYGIIWEALLSEPGLNYSQKPKALIKFHTRGTERRTPLEEHLIEAIRTVRDDQALCRIHFTVSEEQEAEFKDQVEMARTGLEERNGARLAVDFSRQKRRLDTLAVDLEDHPLRDPQGDLVFRPAGHGALLDNLNELGGDLVFIKNIDNVAVGSYLEITIEWKKRLAGFLVGVQAEIFNHLSALSRPAPDGRSLDAALSFARDRLGIGLGIDHEKESADAKRKALVDLLNRPLRVCGMVPNQGEAGGGPFWVRDRDGKVSLQIVESAQVDPEDPSQLALFKSSSHFNPVDLVCGVRDREGRPFDLKKYSDPEAVFISRKSMDGKALKALELPGLWNGAMAGWISLFVEVPLETFNPVKTVFDLLKPAHQS